MNYRKPTWAKKVPPEKIRRLYEQDAKGIYDEELADDVGISLYARVDSMIMVTSSNLGHPLCIECRTEIPNSWQKGFISVCPNCGWTTDIFEYRATYKGQTLNGVGALPDLKEFAAKYPTAKTYAEKMRMIDFLIHSFHGSLSEMPSRPTATNVIEGSAGDVAKFIFDLAYGEGSTVASEELDKWLEKFNRSISKNIDPSTGRLKEGKEYLYDGIGKNADKKRNKNEGE
ncbi:MAG: hypothetical protein FWD71_10875 [Oscillospiraceae bacterium]|nr:hypothetical protein [Oscillospiraceae bacterium]